MVSNITVVDNETIEIDEGEYYLLLVLLNGSTDTSSCNEADEEPFAENYFEEQGDEDLMTTDVGRPQKKAKECSERVSLLLRSVLFIFRYLVFCFK